MLHIPHCFWASNVSRNSCHTGIIAKQRKELGKEEPKVADDQINVFPNKIHAKEIVKIAYLEVEVDP